MKTEIVQLRIDPADKAAFQEAAKVSGMSLSAWLVEVARRWLRKDKQCDG